MLLEVLASLKFFFSFKSMRQNDIFAEVSFGEFNGVMMQFSGISLCLSRYQ